MEEFISLFILNFIMIFGGIATYFASPNYFLGLRTTDTLSDERVWYKANKFAGKLLTISGVIMLFVTILFMAFKLKNFLLPLIYINLLVLIVISIISVIYAHSYAKKLKKEEGEKPLILKKTINYIFIIVCISLIIIGLILPFTKPNPFVGVRIQKTFESFERWKIINLITGILIAIYGAIFSYIFYKLLKKDDLERTKLTLKAISIFFLILILITIFTIFLSYLT